MDLASLPAGDQTEIGAQLAFRMVGVLLWGNSDGAWPHKLAKSDYLHAVCMMLLKKGFVV